MSGIQCQLLVPYKCSDLVNCEKDKMPICALMKNQQTQNFANLCEACADQNVDWYYFGKCEDFSEEQKNEISFVGQEVQCTSHPAECLMEIVAPVCGKTATNSLSTYDNPCEACKDQSVQSYTYGKCQQNLKQLQCTSHPKFCLMQIVVPVCGLNALTNQLQTFANPCLACSNINVQTYTMGKCSQTTVQEELIFDPVTNEIQCNSHPKVCLMDIVAPVCGKNIATNQLSTFLNPCLACSNPQVDSYKFGKCQQQQIDEEELEFDLVTRQIKCLTHPKGCMMEVVAPVCGLNQVNNQLSTFMNPCLACADSQVSTYTFGKCDQDKNAEIFDIVTKPYQCLEHPKGCAMQIVALVCGKTSTNTYSTFLNPCLACQDETIESYKFGKCEEQEKQQQETLEISLPTDDHVCEDHPTACMMEIVVPVCAKSNSNTLQTFYNPCLACQNKDTLSYTFGRCK